jgi:hypothetical protein
MSAVLITGMSGAGKSTIAHNEWGRIGDTREHLRRRLPGHQDRLRAFGVIPIDARQPLDQVVDAILSCTVAGSATSQASKPSDQPAR